MESTILVCDVCGEPATETVTIRTSDGNRLKDLCGRHLDELLKSTRAPRRGRKKAVIATPRRGRPKRH